MKNRAFDHSKYERWIDPSNVLPYEKNAKNHTKRQIKNICQSIKRFGWQQDVVITSDNVLVIGHGRRLAAMELGCEMPYHVIDKTADELTDEDIRELRLVDNMTNAETDFDVDMKALESLDLTFDGFDFSLSDDSDKEKKESEKNVQEMQLKAFEHHDYIVFVFDNQFDWLNAVERFGLERVDAGYGTTKKVGLGRVVKGSKLLKELGYQDSGSEPGAFEFDKNDKHTAELD